MILDDRALLSDKQAITATAASTESYDLKALGITYDGVQLRRRLSIKQVPFMIQVTEDFDNLTTLEFQFQTDDDPAFGSAKTLFSVVVPLAELDAGFQLPIEYLPRNITERFFRMNYVVVGAAPSTGKVSVGIVSSVDAGYKG